MKLTPVILVCLVASAFLQPREADASAIHDAVRAGNLSDVRSLVARDPGVVNERDARGQTPLHVASEVGDQAIAAFLLTSGAGVDAVDELGRTPVHLAAAAGHGPVAETLLSAGADPRAICRDGRTLLHSAAAGGLVGLMERLLTEGFGVDAPDRYGRTPLFWASQSGSADGAEWLLTHGADVNRRADFQMTPLHEATFSGNLRLLDVLVRHGADVNAVNEAGSTPLLYVSQAGRVDVIEWLLAHGAALDVRNTWNETPLSWPLVNGFQTVVERLWPRFVALEDDALIERYPVHRAAYHGNADAVAFLLAKGVDVGLPDESGRTPLQRAAQGGNVKVAQMLLDRGARLTTDPEGASALHLAARKGQTDMVRFLLRKGLDAGTLDGTGRTALDLALEYSYPGVARVLEAAGARPMPGADARTLASLLARPLAPGEAIVWSLGHCGFAVKTRSRLLIFDYFSRGPARDRPSLANGVINPDEIKDLDVVVFVSHAHGDHFDPAILSWREHVEHITYVFGWNARQGDRAIDLPAPRAATTLDGMEIFTVNDEHDTVPEVAYLVRVDGLSIYHGGDYVGAIADRKADMDYLLGKAGQVDLAFVQRIAQAEALLPTVVFPTHAADREYMYGAFAREAEERGLPFRVICPENKGDRYFVSATRK